MDISGENLSTAIDDFRRARSRAGLKELMSRLTGESTELFSYNEVRQKLKLRGGSDRGVKDIPLDSIIGSVGRYTDFTREFLPRQEVNPERWARVKVAASGMVGLPPIDVYQIGEVYFVKDGNHRVSVARQFGAIFIQAYVTEVKTRVPVKPDIMPDDLIRMAEYVEFLERTKLDELRPGSDFRTTIPGQYQVLLEHISVHCYFMGIDFQGDIKFSDAVTHWFDEVYLPVIRIIHNLGILHYFPGRTETDLYLWIARHRGHLEQQLGWEITTENAAHHFLDQNIASKVNSIGDLGDRMIEALLPEKLSSGPPIGDWRTQVKTRGDEERLFLELLVPINGNEDGWCALDQALVVASLEGSKIHGVHIVRNKAEITTPETRQLQEIFQQRCEQAQIDGNLVITHGQTAEQICFRAAVSDIVITNLSYPPGSKPLERLSSGFHDLVQRCPRPLLATPQTISPLRNILLAYDGSLKAQEALYLATYMASCWGVKISVITVEENRYGVDGSLAYVQEYLENHAIQAECILENGPVSDRILATCERNHCDLLVIGGYGLNPLLDMVFGSTVDQLLRLSPVPLLICR